MAITTGSVPSSVFIPPHGRLEELALGADLIFKGRVLSSLAVTNASFPSWGKPHATRFSLISVLKGRLSTNELIFWHNTSGPNAWGGGRPPSWHQFEVGQSYIVFAATLEKPDYLYSPPADATNRPSEFRQLRNDGVMRTADARPVRTHDVKGAHWEELKLLLNDPNPTNQLYGIDAIDCLSLAGRHNDSWARGGMHDRSDDFSMRSDDFSRIAVLSALEPLVTNKNETVASSAIACFETETNAEITLAPFAPTLVKVANENSSSIYRLGAIRGLSGLAGELVTNSLSQLLKNPDENVRQDAVLLLPEFPDRFAEQALRERAMDASPKVRAAVAEVIGNGKIVALLPTLEALFSAPVGPTNPVPPLTLKDLQAGGRLWGTRVGDVHTSAGDALLKFDVEAVGEFLKANISDEGFSLSFVRKLAPNGAEPYLPLLAKELKAHTAGSEQEAARIGFHWSLSYWLIGNYGWAWDTLFEYVSKQTRETLADSRTAPMLDALQIADDPGDARTRALYGFFLDKGMIDRAKELRRGITRRTEDKAILKETFNFPALLKAFDEMDEKHSLKPGLGL